MNQTKRPIDSHKAYHAHVYFDGETRDIAKTLCEEIARKFNLKVGKFHENPIGPHPVGSCQVSFGRRDFQKFIPWLDHNRNKLTIFVHPLSGDNLADHTEFASWLGCEMPLNLDIFEQDG